MHFIRKRKTEEKLKTTISNLPQNEGWKLKKQNSLTEEETVQIELEETGNKSVSVTQNHQQEHGNADFYDEFDRKAGPKTLKGCFELLLDEYHMLLEHIEDTVHKEQAKVQWAVMISIIERALLYVFIIALHSLLFWFVSHDW